MKPRYYLREYGGEANHLDWQLMFRRNFHAVGDQQARYGQRRQPLRSRSDEQAVRGHNSYIWNRTRSDNGFYRGLDGSAGNNYIVNNNRYPTPADRRLGCVPQPLQR